MKTELKTEQQLVDWANRIRLERGLKLDEISYDLEEAGIMKVSYQYICNALSNGVKTNGIAIAMAIIEHYEGVKFHRKPDNKPVPYFAIEEAMQAA